MREDTKKTYQLPHTDFLEKEAFRYESRQLPRIIRTFRQRNTVISNTEFNNLLDIYLNIKQRNLYYRAAFESFDLSGLADKEINKLRPLTNWIGKRSGENYESFMDKIKALLLEDESLPEELHRRTLLETARGENEAINKTKKALSTMSLYVLEPAAKTEFFITSDNPGYTFLGDRIFNTHFGQFTGIIFPINSNQTVLLCGRTEQSPLELYRKIHFVNLDTKGVDMVNHGTIHNAIQHVFCENKNYLRHIVGKYKYLQSGNLQSSD